MDWMKLLQEVCELCLIPLLGALTAYVIKFIKAKSAEIKNRNENALTQKYIDLLTQTICDCVVATNQTYVEALKKENAFTKEAQEEAFNRTYQAVMNILNDDAKMYLQVAVGDLKTYITQKIEAAVNENK